MDTRSKLHIRIDALQRLFMVNTMSGLLPLYIVTEYPKSGGSWLSQMIADYLDIPFPRNRRPDIKSSVMHGHMLYSPFMKNVTCLYRDGRDVMVSLYYHMLFKNEKNAHDLVDRVRADLGFDDPNDIHANLRVFIEYTYRIESRSRSPFKFTWSEFVNSWLESDAVPVRYEDMTSDCYSAMSGLLSRLTGLAVDEEKLAGVVSKYSFEAQSRRKPGEEQVNSFIRKGEPGDWLNKFSPDAAELFDELYGAELVKLGYVDDGSWKSQLDDRERSA